MSSSDLQSSRNTSMTHDCFQMMFESADLYSSFWQPMLKGVGRWHLEMANLNAKHGQAALQLGRDVAHSFTPADVAQSYGKYWQTVSSQYTASSERIAASVSQTVQAPLTSEVVPLPSKRGRDTLVIPDPVALPDRKVA